jgi:hypothetical protein
VAGERGRPVDEVKKRAKPGRGEKTSEKGIVIRAEIFCIEEHRLPIPKPGGPLATDWKRSF